MQYTSQLSCKMCGIRWVALPPWSLNLHSSIINSRRAVRFHHTSPRLQCGQETRLVVAYFCCKTWITIKLQAEIGWSWFGCLRCGKGVCCDGWDCCVHFVLCPFEVDSWLDCYVHLWRLIIYGKAYWCWTFIEVWHPLAVVCDMVWCGMGVW